MTYTLTYEITNSYTEKTQVVTESIEAESAWDAQVEAMSQWAFPRFQNFNVIEVTAA